MRSSITGSSRRTRPVPFPIPSARALDKELRAARVDLARSNTNTVPRPPTTPNSVGRRCEASRSPTANSESSCAAARARVVRLFERRRDALKRVEVRDLSEQAVVKLATERKHLTDIIKMIAYQAESDLLALLRPRYARADQEGRTLLHELFATAGDIRVSDSEATNHTGSTQLAPPNARRQSLVREFRPDSDDPGSRLRIRFAVHPPPRIGLAFPGSPGERYHRRGRRSGALTGHFCATLCQELWCSEASCRSSECKSHQQRRSYAGAAGG